MFRNRFEHILKCLHVVPKDSIIHDWKDSSYNPIHQVQWLIEQLVKSYQTSWNNLEFLYVDECMVPYNGRFFSFKQYIKVKPISHGIKI